MFGRGISYAGDVLDLAVANGIIAKAGAWFSYNGTQVAQGRENVKKYLEANPDVLKEVTDKIYAANHHTGTTETVQEA